MDTLHRSPSYRRSRKHRKGPPTVGRLIDLYLTTQAYVVKTNYLLSDSMTVEDQEQYQELRTDILNNEVRAQKIFQTLKLPRWRSLPEDLRQVFIMAAVGSLPDAFAVSCNLGPRAAKRASEASRGSADYVGRKLRSLIDIAPELAVVLEDAAHRQGCNPGLHFHASLRIAADQVGSLKAAVRKLFASDYVEVADNQAVLIKSIHEPGRWGSYCSKTLLKANQVDKAVFATKVSSRVGEQLYNKLMQWLRDLPAPDVLQSDLNGLLRQLVSSKPRPELLQLINQHAQRRRETQYRRGQRTRHLKSLAATNPDQFTYELVETLRAASEKLEISDRKHGELAGDAIFNGCIDDKPEPIGRLIERYRDLPGIGTWATTDGDDEPLFGYHPDPDS